MSINDIKNMLQDASMEELTDLIKKFESDERAGVIRLVESAKKKITAFEVEKIRTQGMKKYEKKYEECRYICGIDEVGRGPLAGPVVAAAVILPKDKDIYYLNDSKQLSEKRAAL